MQEEKMPAQARAARADAGAGPSEAGGKAAGTGAAAGIAAAGSAVERIHEFERFGSILGLERMTELCQRLGNPEKRLACIHVAGTNGKGSVCKYLYEVLRENGYKAGLYTSPFLMEFNERIELDGAYISNEDLETYTERVLAAAASMVAAGLESPTEFEVVTAMAFLYFAEKSADLVVLEVGLGGAGDSTNVIEKPLISVITSISYDHMDRLGDTLAAIAGEKAGIIKQGAPVVAGVEPAEAAKVIARRAYEKRAALYDASKIAYGNVKRSLTGYTFDATIYGTDYSGVSISMIGEHQIRNAVTALTALEVLRRQKKIRLERSRLLAGMKRAVQIGRFELLSGGEGGGAGPAVILDGAHNEAGAAALAAAVKAHFGEKPRLLMVLGVLADKDVEKILDHLCEVCDDFIATEPDSPRRLTAFALGEKLKARHKRCDAIPEPAAACRAAAERGGSFDAVLFAGSLYLIGKVRRVLKGGEG